MTPCSTPPGGASASPTSATTSTSPADRFRSTLPLPCWLTAVLVTVLGVGPGAEGKVCSSALIGRPDVRLGSARVDKRVISHPAVGGNAWTEAGTSHRGVPDRLTVSLPADARDRKSTRLNSRHVKHSYD